ncbi:hypothetical protein [Frankia sp. Cr2]|uniref:hypothetical protein n=1 Tax=Frankia sp. Cr2 TaxID=3073932 RepID=UPI002AD43F66|nr:hypothetical protein [Frankia sp. Cr2]
MIYFVVRLADRPAWRVEAFVETPTTARQHGIDQDWLPFVAAPMQPDIPTQRPGLSVL